VVLRGIRYSGNVPVNMRGCDIKNFGKPEVVRPGEFNGCCKTIRVCHVSGYDE
jgi:hypothetical protein